MQDNEIIKALECCNSPFSEYRCCSCPLDDTDNCKKALRIVCLDLINRQQAEIERLNDVKFQYEILQKNYDEIEQQFHYLNNVEIPYLYSFTEDKDKKLEVIANILLGARKKAIKEFAERLKENKIDIDVSFGYGREVYTEAVAVIEIDNLVKEMTGTDFTKMFIEVEELEPIPNNEKEMVGEE